MIDLIREASDFQTFLLSKKWRFCFIGGLAVQQWGEPRLTRDIDISILTGFGSELTFINELLSKYSPRIENAREFAQEKRVLLLTGEHHIDIDVSLGALPYEETVVSRAQDIEILPGQTLRICSPEDLIVLKAFADRAIDWHDIEGVLARQGKECIDWSYVDANLRPLAELKERPEILIRLKSLRE